MVSAPCCLHDAAHVASSRCLEPLAQGDLQPPFSPSRKLALTDRRSVLFVVSFLFFLVSLFFLPVVRVSTQSWTALQRTRHIPCTLLRAGIIDGDGDFDIIPPSPAALLRSVEAAKAAPPPPTPYRILTQCPSPAPLTMFVLGVYDAKTDAEVMAAMRTRTQTDDLSGLFDRPNGFLSQDRFQEGILVFETSADAVAYSKIMEASGLTQVASAEVPTEELFSMLSAARAVAVYFPGGARPPVPADLQAMLGSPSRSRWGG